MPGAKTRAKVKAVARVEAKAKTRAREGSAGSAATTPYSPGAIPATITRVLVAAGTTCPYATWTNTPPRHLGGGGTPPPPVASAEREPPQGGPLRRLFRRI